MTFETSLILKPQSGRLEGRTALCILMTDY